MLSKNLKSSLLLLHGILITAMVVAVSAGSNDNPTATGQTGNATSATNQTSAANQTSQSMGNLTTGTFLPVLDNLAEARDAIFDDSNSGTFIALNAADDELFRLFDRVFDQGGLNEASLLKQQITPVREKINDAQDAVVDGDMRKALQDLNSASTALVRITLQLPSGEIQ
jgi:hypothetical protein